MKVKRSMGPEPPTGAKTIKSGSAANLAAAKSSFDKPTDMVFLFRKVEEDRAN